MREAKNTRLKLIEAVIEGEDCCRAASASPIYGRGFLKDRICLNHGCDSLAEDEKIETAFEAVGEAGIE